MRHVLLLALCLVAASAVPARRPKIVGGEVTTIDRYPTIAALLVTYDCVTYWQGCGASIINSRHVLTAAHCIYKEPVARSRVRVGSTWINSGGKVHVLESYITHHNYDPGTLDNDVAILRTVSAIAFNSNVQPGLFAGTNYNVADNDVLWAAGWGATEYGFPHGSEQLRHVQVYKINHDVCGERYDTVLSPNMLCSGVLDVGGRDQCQGDSGSPLYHNNVIVGVCSWGNYCADPRFPGVNARVSRYVEWIRQNS